MKSFLERHSVEEIKSALLECAAISNVLCFPNKPDTENYHKPAEYTDGKFRGQKYDAIATFDLGIDERNVKIAVGFNDSWKFGLFDFYVIDYKNDVPFMPHVEKNGKLCIADLEGILIDNAESNFSFLLLECIDRVIDILSKGFSGDNRDALIKEFCSYWGILPGCKEAIAVLPLGKSAEIIKYILPQKDIHKGSNGDELCLRAATLQTLPVWKWEGTVHNGCYFEIVPVEKIYPPDPRTGLNIDYCNALLSYVTAGDARRVIAKCNPNPVVLLGIHEPGDIFPVIGFRVKDGKIVLDGDALKLSDGSAVTPIYVERRDRKFLMSREEEANINCLADKKFLLIGCGSIGGYLATLMAKAGCEQIALIDGDTFSADNIFRHVLGMESVGKNKAKALKDYLKNTIPEISVSSSSYDIQKAIGNKFIQLEDYDVIISATGSHVVNRWINAYACRHHLNAEFLYAWNEPLDIGCHALYIKPRFWENPSSCYESLLAKSETCIFDQSAYCEKDQTVSRNQTGCGGSYIPYGSDVSLRSAMLVMDLLKRSSDGRLNGNTLISEKGEGYYFNQSGLRTSAVYDAQESMVEEKVLNSFGSRCSTCKINGD